MNKAIPTLTGNAALDFIRKADQNYLKKGSVNFDKQFEKLKEILSKAKLS